MTDPLSPENLARLEEITQRYAVSIDQRHDASRKAKYRLEGMAANGLTVLLTEDYDALIARVKEQEAQIAELEALAERVDGKFVQAKEDVLERDATISRLRALLERCRPYVIAEWGDEFLVEIDAELNPSLEGQPKCK